MSAGWRSVRPMRRRSEHKVEGRDVRGRPLNGAASVSADGRRMVVLLYYWWKVYIDHITTQPSKSSSWSHWPKTVIDIKTFK